MLYAGLTGVNGKSDATCGAYRLEQSTGTLWPMLLRSRYNPRYLPSGLYR